MNSSECIVLTSVPDPPPMGARAALPARRETPTATDVLQHLDRVATDRRAGEKPLLAHTPPPAAAHEGLGVLRPARVGSQRLAHRRDLHHRSIVAARRACRRREAAGD